MFRLLDKDTNTYFEAEPGKYLEFETKEHAETCLASWHINAIKRKNAGQWLPALNFEIIGT